VAHVATWVIAALRKTTFTSLPELAAAIGDRIEAYNTEPFQKRPGSRMSVFVAEEQPLLKPLPRVAYEISRWVYGRTVARDGHVVWARNHYSVPFVHIGGKVDLRITDRVLEAYRGPERLTSHLLLPGGSAGNWRTNDADLPAGDRYQPWDADRVREWAGRIGPAAVTVVNRIFESVPIDEQGLDPALAVLRLSRRYSADRVEAASRLALAGRVRSPRYAHLKPILDSQWLARALKKGVHERLLPYGLAARDIIEYLPAEAIVPKAHKSWVELRAEHDAARPGLDRSKGLHDFKTWLTRTYAADVSPQAIGAAAATVTDIPCLHRIRAHYIRMPDLEEAWALARDKPQGQMKFLRK